MKKYALLFLTAVAFAACKNDDDKPNPGGGGGGNSDTIDVRGTISANTNWSKSKVYRLRGYVYVDNATLTIEAGTTIISKKDSAGVLVIYKGSQLIANGTAASPIVFTSGETEKAPGDLGGVILVGKATGNGNHGTLEGGVNNDHKLFGGTDDHDNSGSMKYVRIEYAGKAVADGDEVNGLSLYGVGDATTLDHIEVIRGLDDAFEFFGGTVNAKYLIAYNCADDDFDMDDGYRGKIQYAISVKDPKFTDPKGTTGDVSNNFEVDNTNPSNKPVTSTPITHPLLSNFTAIGPNNGAGVSSDYGFNMRFRRGSSVELVNSIVIGGQKAGLHIDDDATAAFFISNEAGVRNTLLQAYANPYEVQSVTLLDAAALKALVEGNSGSQYFANAADVKLTDPFNNAAPNLKPAAGSPALATAGKFEDHFNDAFFDKTNFVGALDAGTDWTSGWAKFGM
ncbi:MAG TPA: hypothetical protein VGC22_00985 [Chitinophaga sp.]